MKNQLYLEKRVNEVNSMLTEVFESRVREIIKEPESFSKYKKDIFEQWISILGLYKKPIKKEGRFFTRSSHEYIFLGVLFEGLAKIILFFNSPMDYLAMEPKNRVLGKLKHKLIVCV